MLDLKPKPKGLEMPKMRRLVYADGSPFYLSRGVVTEDGKPKVSVTRWDADYVLRQIEKQKGVPEGTLSLPTLYESHEGAKQDTEINGTIFFPQQNGKEPLF